MQLDKFIEYIYKFSHVIAIDDIEMEAVIMSEVMVRLDKRKTII
jgi:hypothetical protein